MDPISQGALGAIAASATARSERVRIATLTGWGAGILADADIFIRSSADPLLNLEYHRHFTHSLIFIPIGAAIAAAFFWAVSRIWKPSFSELYRYSLFGYATAGLLDACTSYGTRLLWPFSDARIAWNIISIVDPIFTGTIVVLIVLGFIGKKIGPSRLAWAFALTYLSFGIVQNHRAYEAFQRLAAERDHDSASRLTVKPSIGNLFLWRGIYEYEGNYRMDAVRLPSFAGEPLFYEGESVAKVDLKSLKEGLPVESVLALDLDRFEHFSDGYLSWHPGEVGVIADARYALLPQSAKPLWGIEVDLNDPDSHAQFVSFRRAEKSDRAALWRMIRGKPLEE